MFLHFCTFYSFAAFFYDYCYLCVWFDDETYDDTLPDGACINVIFLLSASQTDF